MMVKLTGPLKKVVAASKGNFNIALENGKPICDVNSGLKTYGSPKELSYRIVGNIHKDYPKLAEVLDIGEFILRKGFPQKGKLFTAYALEKFNLVEFINRDEQEVKKVELSSKV